MHTRRPVRFVELVDHAGWRIKLYGIRQGGERPDERLLELGRITARMTLPRPAVTADRYGVAFVTVHQANLFNQIVVDWWERLNELRHRVHKAVPEAPEAFADITATGEAFCVWELAVIGHERSAWLRHVLEATQPNLDAYLEDTLSGLM